MTISESSFLFSCEGAELLGILAKKEASGNLGVLVVVGGPQYRAGSHRQFLLLSRALAGAGFPTMRFDLRGTGDSTGESRSFDAISDDIGAAIDAFIRHSPTIQHVVLWGLCDAASASLLYWDASRDSRIVGLALLNPWVRSDATIARTHIKHYYAQRLLQVEFWKKLLRGELGIRKTAKGLAESIRVARSTQHGESGSPADTFQEKMARACQMFPGRILVLLSGNDFTAKEFQEAVRADRAWDASLREAKVTMSTVPDADHTCSSRSWRGEVEVSTIEWLRNVARS